MTTASEYRQKIVKSLVRDDLTVTSDPYFYCVIDDLLGNLAGPLCEEANLAPVDRFVYDSPLEKKRTTNSWEDFGPEVYSYFAAMNSSAVSNQVSNLLGSAELEPDFGLHGGGLHRSGNGDHLNLHLDYENHPKTGLRRHVNAIYFASQEWREDWHGALELWEGDSDPRHQLISIYPKRDRLVLFEVGDVSWHGFPKSISCPPETFRTTLANYYCRAESKIDASRRTRALFAPTSSQKNDPNVLDLIFRRSRESTFGDAYRTLQ